MTVAATAGSYAMMGLELWEGSMGALALAWLRFGGGDGVPVDEVVWETCFDASPATSKQGIHIQPPSQNKIPSYA